MAESGFPGGFGAVLEQAQQMAKKLAEQREKIEHALSEARVEADSGGGMVRVTASGDGKIRSVKIDPAVVDPGDLAMLEDLIQAAVNAALRKAEELARGERSKLAGGLSLPAGLNLGDLLK